MPGGHTENDHFRKLLTYLRPGLKLPNRRHLSGTLLTNLYEQEYQKMGRWVDGKLASLSVDGWSGITREPVVGVALTVDRRTFLVNIENTEGRPHTAGLFPTCP